MVVALGLAGVQGWRWWTGKQARGSLRAVRRPVAGGNGQRPAKAKDATAQLQDRFARTGYAPRGALVMARLLYDNGDAKAAREQLQWVIDRADETELKEIARYRLAELMLDEKQYDDALKMLDAKHGEPFAGLYADLRGDALVAAGRIDDAKQAYQTALTKLDSKSQYRNYVQVKLESLGGTAAAPVGGGSAVAPAVAPAPAAVPAPAAPKK